MPTGSWSERQRQHDEVAVPAVEAAWLRHGFRCYTFGQEGDAAGLREALQRQTDRTSLMLRFRPDRVFVKDGLRSVLCEIKSEGEGRRRFALEADSYLAAKTWNAGHRHLAYAFVDLGATVAVRCCWADLIPSPDEILVPSRRWEPKEEQAQRKFRLSLEFPDAALTPWEQTRGSGTPFFFVPKNADYLRPVDEFLDVEVGRRMIFPCPVPTRFAFSH